MQKKSEPKKSKKLSQLEFEKKVIELSEKGLTSEKNRRRTQKTRNSSKRI